MPKYALWLGISIVGFPAFIIYLLIQQEVIAALIASLLHFGCSVILSVALFRLLTKKQPPVKQYIKTLEYLRNRHECHCGSFACVECQDTKEIDELLNGH